MVELKIYPNFELLIGEAVANFIQLADRSIKQSGFFTVSLSGGTTPESFYRKLADPANQEKLAWQGIHLFWGDERPVPPNHPDSNFRMAEAALLSRVPIPDENIHRVPAEMDLQVAALNYEEMLRRFFESDWPRFDLVLLGMGEDGHTASLFPKSAGLSEEKRWFIPNYAPTTGSWRLTLTKNAINHARAIWVLIRGKSKAETLAKVLTGAKHAADYPIQLISPEDGQMVWMVDEDAAMHLQEELD